MDERGAPRPMLGDVRTRTRGSFIDHMSLGSVPPKSERVKDSDGQKIAKLCGHEWQPRYLVLTPEMLMITHLGHSEISDQIPLVTQFHTVFLLCIWIHIAFSLSA